MDLSKITHDILKVAHKHSPTILTVVGGLGVAATAYFSHRAGMKSARSIDYNERHIVDEPLTAKAKVQLTWQYYIVPLSIGIATVACIATSNVINVKRQTALIGAYTLGERALAVYRDKMVEQLGVEGEKKLREEIVQESAAEVPKTHKHVTATELNDIFVDTFSGQTFVSDLKTVKDAMEDVNRVCCEEGYVSMNHFYGLIGARQTQLGEVMGWTTDRMLELIIVPITKEDGEIMHYGIDYRKQPTMEYHREVW